MERMCRKIVKLTGVLAAATGFAVAVPAHGFAADNIVVDWNATAVTTALAAGQGPVPQTRSMAIVAVAVHDAVNAISRRYATYDVVPQPPAGASVDAAAAGAAYRALTLLYPQSDGPHTALQTSMSKYGFATSDPAFVFGELVAEQIVGLRSNDGASLAQYPYTAPGAGSPGVWVPTPPANAAALLPGWGQVLPWVLHAASQFRPDHGPSLTSDRYTSDFNEVKEMGSLASATRTSEQTNIARFWLTSAVVVWDGALREVAQARGLDVPATAYAFALVNLAGADAAIACWDAKYTFDFWRPITAIRNADADDNPSTSPDVAWVPLVPTPPFPEFTSGHTMISGAMATMLGLLFGDDPGVTFTVRSPTNPEFPRTWSRFSAGIDEVIDARVWTGIHFRTSDVVGARMGRQVARFVFEHALRRTRP